MKRRKNIRPEKLLPLALCLAAVLGGAWICLLHVVLPRREPAPQTEPEARVETAVAEPLPADELEPLSMPEEPATVAKAEPVPSPARTKKAEQPLSLADKKHETRPAREKEKKAPAPRPAARPVADKKTADLSAYRVRAHSAEGESFLPKDTSLTVKDLNALQKGGKEKEFDGGKGLIGDIYRGGKRLVESMDDATLSATRRVLGNVAQPEKAKLRPGGGGVRLSIEIPPESLQIGR